MDYSNIFLIFRTFDHDRNGPGTETKIQNKYEDISIKNPRYLDYITKNEYRRPYNHLEVVLPNKMWWGIKNVGNCKVFLKDRVDFEQVAENVYPQTVMIQIDDNTKALCYSFCENSKGEGFDDCSLLWNFITSHIFKVPSLSKINKKNKWYCTKLTIELLRSTGIIKQAEIDALTATAEDIYWFCVDKEKTKDSENLPKFWVYDYNEYPEEIFKKSKKSVI